MAEVEDEDSWLYGDNDDKNEQKGEPKGEIVASQDETEPEDKIIKQENGLENTDSINDPVKEKSEQVKSTKEDEDEDSDDDVQVTIGEITTGGTPTGFPVGGLRSFYRNPVAVAPKPVVSKGLDLDAPGDINGTPVMETNIDLLDEKPWRKPGADISDYFNYGFNEDTWKQYCEKQKKLRSTNEIANLVTLSIPKPMQNGLGFFGTPRFVPMPKFENTVRTISALQFSRRKEDEVLLQNAAGGLTIVNSSQETPPSSTVSRVAMPQSSSAQVFLPPIRPHMSGTLPSTPLPFPPMNPGQPPPGIPLGMPPPGFMISGVPPPNMPPPNVVQHAEFLQQAPSAFQPEFQTPIPQSGPPPFFNQHDAGRDEYNPFEDHHKRLSDAEGEQHSEEDGRYKRERGSSSRRDYDRERREYGRREYRDGRTRDRGDRDRDREKEKERSRDRDREGSRRYREDSPRHKASRRKHEEDDRHSSKHKKIKKHKHKDSDREGPPGTDEGPMIEDK